MVKRALLVVDLQNEYLADGRLPLTGIADAVAKAGKVITAARVSGEPVIHIRHEAPAADAPFFVPGSPGTQIIAEVAPRADETVIVKHYPNSFRATDLKAHLDDKGVDTLVILGAMSHMCIEATARAAADFGYVVTVIHDACATLDLTFDGIAVPAAQVHAASMAALTFGYAKTVSADMWLA